MSQIFDLLHQDFREVQRPRPKEVDANPPLFRTFERFLTSTLNPQHFSGVEMSHKAWQESLHAHEKWFYYQQIRRPNQFSRYIGFREANTFLVEGIKGNGKSSILDNISAVYPKDLVIYMAGDDEGLADFRMYDHRNDPSVPKSIQERIGEMERRLIVGPPGVSVKSSYNYVTFDKLTLNDIENHDVIVMPQRLHKYPETIFKCGEKILALIQLRQPEEDSKGEIFLKVLESADIVYSRIALKGAKTEAAKAYLVFLERKMRHYGVALGMDFQYSNSLDLEVKVNADYSFVKNMGSDRLHPNIDWMYGFTHPVGLMSLYKNEFVCKDKYGGMFVGWFMLPPWHKTPKENIYRSLDIIPDFALPENLPRISTPQLEDVALEMEIISYFSNPTNKGKSLRKAEKEMGRSRDTIAKYLKLHEAKECSHYRNS